MNRDEVQVGLIGCGKAAERLYAPTLPRVRGVSVSALVDPREERRTLLGEAFGGDCKGYETVEAMLNESAVDAVIVATPPSTHASLAREALLRSRWVLVEKPLTGSAAQAEPMLAPEVADLARHRLMVGYNRRYWRPIVRLREAMGRGRSPSSSSSSRSSPSSPSSSSPIEVDVHFSIDATGWGPVTGLVDPLDDLATHYLDLLQAVFDANFQRVSARRTGEREVTLDVKMDGEIHATLRHAHTDHTIERMRVRTDDGRFMVRIGSNRIRPACGAWRRAADLADRVSTRLGFAADGGSFADSYVSQFEHFFDCVREDRAPTPGLDAGLSVVRVTDAARRSAERGGEEITIQ